MDLIELVLKHLVINHFLHSYYSELKIVGKAYFDPHVFSISVTLKKETYFIPLIDMDKGRNIQIYSLFITYLRGI